MNPQNPYDSYIIEASAGAGKTYQLTRRFLNLVSAGAHPSAILTITFTVKAASEMKERIIHEASNLLYTPKRQEEFDREMQSFYKSYSYGRHPIPAPRSAKKTAEAILSSTQLLRVTTIDALFYEWFASFPWEANPFPSSTQMRSLPYEMIDGLNVNELNTKAWEHVFTNKSEETLQECFNLFKLDPDQGILGIEQKIFELFRHYTFLWQSEQETGEAGIQYKISENYTEKDFFFECEEDLKNIIGAIKNNEEFFFALQKQSLQALMDSRLLNQEGEISGTFLRGKNRETVREEIFRVHTALKKLQRIEKLTKLNDASASLFVIYKFWLEERENLKKKKGWVEFHDLAIGNYKLFHEPAGIGATWFLQKSFQHMMIDECQDTSFLQFSVFRKLIEEILSQEESTVPGTVFLVGDKKQSIYGFREAEPEVLEHMNALFQTFEKHCIPLHKSYRSAPVILDFVNKVFIEKIDPNFPPHATACSPDNEPVVPNCGRIHVQELTSEALDKEEAIRVEADYLALYLKKALTGEIPHPVYEKKTKSYRPLEASDCVILYRSSTHLDIFEAALRQYEISYLREEKKGFFERPEIRDVLACVKFLCDPTQMIALLTFLKSPLAKISDRELLTALSKTQNSERRELALLDCFKDSELYFKIRSLLLSIHTRSPSQILYKIYESFSAFTVFGKTDLEAEIVYKNLLKLYEMFLSLEREQQSSLNEVLTELELQEEKNEVASASAQGHAVRLMTVHKAKGLEFPFVAVVKTSELWYRMDRYWAKVDDTQGRGLAFIGTQKQRPSSDPTLDSILSTTERELQEEAERLLYVALTRASQYLLLTAHQTKSISDSFYPLLLDTALNSGDTQLDPNSPNSSPHNSGPIGCHQNYPYTLKKREIPDQISIVHPSSMNRRMYTDALVEITDTRPELTSVEARLFGTVIHEALAFEAQKISFDFKSLWTMHVKKIPDLQRKKITPQLEMQAYREIQNLTQSAAWKELFADAKIIAPELRMVQLRRKTLLMGSCDLYIEKKSGDIFVIEWKTKDPGANTDLYSFAEEMGYVQQLRQYAQTIASLKAHAKISSLLWFTKYDKPLVVQS